MNWESAEPKEEEVTLGPISYVLREASSGTASKHKDATFKAVKVNNQTNTSTFGGIADADLVLLSECLFENKTPPNTTVLVAGAPVSVATVRSLPNRISEPLVEYLKEISGMQPKETKESLTKQRETIDAKLAKFNAPESEEEDTAKNSQSGATRS